MTSGTVQTTITVAGMTLVSEAVRTASGQISHDLSGEDVVPAAASGTLSTRTDDDTGVLTLEEGHGITTDDYVDVYWAGGVHYGMDVTVVDGNDVTVDLGSGDNLPAQDTAVFAGVRQEIDSDFDGDNVKIIAMIADQRCHVEFLTEADGSILAVELTPANEAWVWISDKGVANPLTGDPVGKLQVSCGTATAATVQIGILLDTTP